MMVEQLANSTDPTDVPSLKLPTWWGLPSLTQIGAAADLSDHGYGLHAELAEARKACRCPGLRMA